jgi:hypothetical protein
MAGWDHLVVVLPGIGGSVLAQPGRLGEPVWSAGARDVGDLLRRPERLSLGEHERLAPVGLIRSFKALCFPTPIRGYDRLLAALGSLPGAVVDEGTPGGERQDANVVAVPYDFRLGIADAAEGLTWSCSAGSRCSRAGSPCRPRVRYAPASSLAPHDVLDALGRLVDKSLAVAEDRGGAARYRLLETIRQYAQERLGEAGETAVVRDRHLDCFLAFAEAAEPELDRDKDAWRTRAEAEHHNLRAALDWGLAADDPERDRRLAAALPWLWHLHGHGHEGIEFLRRAIDRAPRDRSALQAQLLTGLAFGRRHGQPPGRGVRRGAAGVGHRHRERHRPAALSEPGVVGGRAVLHRRRGGVGAQLAGPALG